MSKVILPYNLKDGQIAYAARVMANLNAILAKMNQVTVAGLAPLDMESALQELKFLLDAEYAADAKVVADFSYDPLDNALVLKLADGALFKLSAAPFVNDYQGADSDSLCISVDGQRHISGEIKPGAISEQMLDSGLSSTLSQKVTAGETGNAEQILFSDGQTMQQKLDSGALNGKDGVALSFDSYYTFRVADNGHLYVGVAEEGEQPQLTINQDGHLIYTVESTAGN